MLHFWVGEIPRGQLRFALWFFRRVRLWFNGSPLTDAEIRRRFGAIHEAAVSGRLDDWERAPRPRLALIIVLDQFSRNLCRGQGESYAQDDRALRAALVALDDTRSAPLHPIERIFHVMPLVHAEHLGMQDRAIEEISRLAAGAPLAVRTALAFHRRAAKKHRDVIARFSRFPHRNAALGRASTPEEELFLARRRATWM